MFKNFEYNSSAKIDEKINRKNTDHKTIHSQHVTIWIYNFTETFSKAYNWINTKKWMKTNPKLNIENQGEKNFVEKFRSKLTYYFNWFESGQHPITYIDGLTEQVSVI